MNNIRTLFLIVVIALTNKALGQSTFRIVGKIEGVKNGNVKLVLPPFDTSGIKEVVEPIEKGKFVISGNFYYPFAAFLILNDSVRSNIFFIDNGQQHLTFSKNQFSTFIPDNTSSTNREYTRFYKKYISPTDSRYDSLDEKANYIRSTYKGDIPVDIMDSLSKVRNEIKLQKETALIEFIRQYPESYIGLWHLYYRLNVHGDRENFATAFSLLSGRLRTTYAGEIIEKRMKELKLTATGAVFPLLRLADTTNNFVNFNIESNNKITLIDFWFSSCKPCIKQFEKFKQLYSLYHDKGFEIIGISTDQTNHIVDWKNAIVKHQITWPQYLDENEVQAKKLAISAYPTNFLIDEYGKVILRDIELAKLQELLKEKLGK